MGSLDGNPAGKQRCFHVHNLVADHQALYHAFEQFCNYEGFGTAPNIPPPIPVADSQALSLFQRTIKHDGTRYEVGLPWKEGQPDLPNNEIASLRRFFQLRRKFELDDEFYRLYSNELDPYVTLGFAHRVTQQEMIDTPRGRANFLTHHGVRNQNKPGRVRVVCHANERTGGLSLNERLYKGPDNLLNLCGVLLRVRGGKYAVSGDIAKMFLQVRVPPADGPALRYHWLPDGESGDPHVYQMDVQVFGLISSPSVCTFAMRQTALDNETKYPGMHDLMLKSFYADNFLQAYDDEVVALAECQKLTELLQLGGFPLEQWCSNSKTIMEAFPVKLSSKPGLDLDLDGLPTERVLGLIWNCASDNFELTVKSGGVEGTSRRQLLSAIGSIFDPLGFLAPLVITLKLILRDTKHSQSGWDAPMEESLCKRWGEWVATLNALPTIHIPRCLQPFNETPVSTELHAFSDALKTRSVRACTCACSMKAAVYTQYSCSVR